MLQNHHNDNHETESKQIMGCDATAAGKRQRLEKARTIPASELESLKDLLRCKHLRRVYISDQISSVNDEGQAEGIESYTVSIGGRVYFLLFSDEKTTSYSVQEHVAVVKFCKNTNYIFACITQTSNHCLKGVCLSMFASTRTHAWCSHISSRECRGRLG